MNTTLSAINYMKKAHAGQRRRNGKPFWTHPFEVFRSIPKKHKKSRILALLHDICEDCGHYPEFVCLSLGLEKEYEDALIAISRRHDETYFEYIDRVGKNNIARLTKKFDLIHNMKTAKPHTKIKYEKALNILQK